MSPRSLIDLILKILGVYFIGNVLEALSRFFSVLVYFPQYASEKEAFTNLAITVPYLVLYSLFCWLLIFRTGSVTRILRLDNFSSADIPGLTVHRSVVLSVAIVLIGGWMLATELPELFRHAVYYYQERKLYVRMARPDVSYLAMSLVKVLLGLVLILFNGRIVNFIEWKRKAKVRSNWPVKDTLVGRRKKKTV